MIKLTRSYKYRLCPNKSQQVQLAKTFGCVRYYWNDLVNSFNSYDKENNPIPSYKTSTEIRQDLKWMKEVSAAALQQKYRDFYQTKSQYFNKDRNIKLGRMSFKRKGYRDSFRLPNQKFKILDDRIKLERIGNVKMIIDRDIPSKAKILSVTVSKTSSGQYFASVNFEINKKSKTKTNYENIGIDLGLSSIITLSNGIQFVNPKKFRENQSRLRTAQKHLSRKKKGSNRWNKQRIKVAKIHQKIVSQRDWYLHNISKWIVENFNEIGMEDLNVKGMIQNRKLSKSISDTSMSKLKFMIDYKQQEYNKQVKLLGRFERSTKECNVCDNVQDMKLSDRIFECNNCGLVMNRDHQAALVIKKKTVGVNAVKNQARSNCKTLHPLVDVRQLRRTA